MVKAVLTIFRAEQQRCAVNNGWAVRRYTSLIKNPRNQTNVCQNAGNFYRFTLMFVKITVITDYYARCSVIIAEIAARSLWSCWNLIHRLCTKLWISDNNKDICGYGSYPLSYRQLWITVDNSFLDEEKEPWFRLHGALAEGRTILSRG